MEGKRYLVTTTSDGFGVIREYPSGEMKFYKLFDEPRDTTFAIKETEDGIAIMKISGRVKIRRKTEDGLKGEYLI